MRDARISSRCIGSLPTMCVRLLRDILLSDEKRFVDASDDEWAQIGARLVEQVSTANFKKIFALILLGLAVYTFFRR